MQQKQRRKKRQAVGVGSTGHMPGSCVTCVTIFGVVLVLLAVAAISVLISLGGIWPQLLVGMILLTLMLLRWWWWRRPTRMSLTRFWQMGRATFWCLLNVPSRLSARMMRAPFFRLLQTPARVSLRLLQTPARVSLRLLQTISRVSLRLLQTISRVSLRLLQTPARVSLRLLQTISRVSLRLLSSLMAAALFLAGRFQRVVRDLLQLASNLREHTHCVFTLALLLSAPDADLLNPVLYLKVIVWIAGMRYSVDSVKRLASWASRGFSSLFIPSPDTDYVIFILMDTVTGAFSVYFAARDSVRCLNLARLAGWLIFTLSYEVRAQRVLKAVVQQAVQVDWLEGMEGELAQMLLMTAEVTVCAALFVGALWGRGPDSTALPPMVAVAFVTLLISCCEWMALLRKSVCAMLRELSSLPRATRRELRERADDVCAVCLGPMSAARVTLCRHLFHGACLRQLLRRGASRCPMCQAPL